MSVIIEGHSMVVRHDLNRACETVWLDGHQVSFARTFAGTWHRFTVGGVFWEVQTRALVGPAAKINTVLRDGATLFPAA